MVTVRAKDFFMTCWRIDRRIEAKFEEVRTLIDTGSKCVASYSNMPRSGSVHSQVENTVMRIMSLRQSLCDTIDEMTSRRLLAQKIIAYLPDDRFKDIITWRYFNKWDWAKIATAMNYEVRQVHRLHGRALQEAQSIIDWLVESGKCREFLIEDSDITAVRRARGQRCHTMSHEPVL